LSMARGHVTMSERCHDNCTNYCE